MSLILLVILLLELHHHETSLDIPRQIPSSFLQNRCPEQQEKFPGCTNAWRHPVVKPDDLLSPKDGLALPVRQQVRQARPGLQK